jgi:hypothetical protein
LESFTGKGFHNEKNSFSGFSDDDGAKGLKGNLGENKFLT